MAQIRPLIKTRIGRQNEPISVRLFDLLVDPLAETQLTADSNSGSGTLTVKNITGFAINQVIIIGESGNEGAEIIKTHASTAPTGSTITLASSTVFPHSAGTRIRVINFDQVEMSNATTLTGAKSVLTTTNLLADQDTPYNDTAGSTGFYFARFKNTITSTFSPYSDGMPVTGYTIFTARSIIDKALAELNKKPSDLFSDEFAFGQIDNCQMECLKELKRWSFMQKFESKVGTTSTGTWKVAVPTDLDDQNTNKSVYNFRIGKQPDMTWVDKEKFDELTTDVAHTTLASGIALNDVTITLTDSGNFDDSGTVYIGANTYSYSANNRTTNVLTITASTTTNSSGADVFSGATLGEPLYWTTYGGYIYHYPVTGSTYTQRNYTMDYYKSLTATTTDSDVIVLSDPLVVQYYLQWKFLLRMNNGEENSISSAQRDNYIVRREKMKQKEVLGKTFRLRPRINDWSKQMRFEDEDGKKIRTGAFGNV